MQFPNAANAVVAKEKIVEYLLNRLHPDGAPKAVFFFAMGFTVNDWKALATAIIKLAIDNEVLETIKSPRGEKFVIDGKLETPSGRAPLIRTVWITERDDVPPRLVTAYPCEATDD